MPMLRWSRITNELKIVSKNNKEEYGVCWKLFDMEGSMTCKNCYYSVKNANEGHVGCAYFKDDIQRFFDETIFEQAKTRWITMGGGYDQ